MHRIWSCLNEAIKCSVSLPNLGSSGTLGESLKKWSDRVTRTQSALFAVHKTEPGPSTGYKFSSLATQRFQILPVDAAAARICGSTTMVSITTAHPLFPLSSTSHPKFGHQKFAWFLRIHFSHFSIWGRKEKKIKSKRRKNK